MENNYKEIVKLLNSPDTDSILLGLEYLKKTDVAQQVVFKPMEYDDGTIGNRIDNIIDKIRITIPWSYALDVLVYHLRFTCNIKEFAKYQDHDMGTDACTSSFISE